MKRGILICFTGIDGSGKTTLARHLEKHLKDLRKTCKYIWSGWRGFESFLFKPIASIIRRKTNSGNKPISTYSLENNFLFDYIAWLDYSLRIFPTLSLAIRMYDLVILDRYVYDVAVNFSLNSKKNSKKLLKNFFRIFPEPDVTFLIDVPEEIAYKRKDDIPSFEYLSIQRKYYLKLLKDNTNVRVLDGNRSKEELMNIVIKEVEGLMKCKK